LLAWKREMMTTITWLAATVPMGPMAHTTVVFGCIPSLESETTFTATQHLMLAAPRVRRWGASGSPGRMGLSIGMTNMADGMSEFHILRNTTLEFLACLKLKIPTTSHTLDLRTAILPR